MLCLIKVIFNLHKNQCMIYSYIKLKKWKKIRKNIYFKSEKSLRLIII